MQNLAKYASSADLLIIAGEHSGDEHAALLIESLLKENPELKIYAIGGKLMEKAGATLLYNLTEHSIIGFVEVVKHYPFFKKLFNNTISWIENSKPKNICFVDYPGFNLRIAKELYERGLAEKAGGSIRLEYYIGPQIWAWKAGRRFKMAKYLNHLGVIFPFEVACYKDTDLDVKFVGHPFVSKGHQLIAEYDADGPILLLPGSRKIAVSRIFPILLDTFEQILKKYPNETARVAYPSKRIKDILEKTLAKRPRLKDKVFLQDNEKLLRGKAVVMSSGTMSFQCALAGIPGVIVYKANALSYFLAQFLANIDRLGIANILLNRTVYPEYIQNKANPKVLADILVNYMENPDSRDEFSAISRELRDILSVENAGYSDVSQWMLGCMK